MQSDCHDSLVSPSLSLLLNVPGVVILSLVLHSLGLFIYLFIFSFFFFLVFYVFRAVPTAYGVSQARGLIGAGAASLHHSHSNAGSKPCLQPTPQLTAAPDP